MESMTQYKLKSSSGSIPIEIDSSQALCEFFKSKNICLRGTIKYPQFRCCDVAAYIMDHNIDRTTKDFSEKYMISVKYSDTLGRERETNFFTERGLYKYLLRSKRPKAEPFQEWVFDVLCEIRKKMLDDIFGQKVTSDKELFATIDKNIKMRSIIESIIVSKYDTSSLGSDHIGMANFYITQHMAHKYFEHNGKILYTLEEIPIEYKNFIYTNALKNWGLSPKEYLKFVASALKELDNTLYIEYLGQISRV
jgi:hypothetical protein